MLEHFSIINTFKEFAYMYLKTVEKTADIVKL